MPNMYTIPYPLTFIPHFNDIYITNFFFDTAIISSHLDTNQFKDLAKPIY